MSLAPPLIVFLLLTGVPILLTPVVQATRGDEAAWGVAVPIGMLTLTCLEMLAWLLSSVRPEVGIGTRT